MSRHTAKQVKEIEDYLMAISPIDTAHIAHLIKHARLKKFKKKEIFIREGEICQELLFTHHGVFRYFLTKDGREFTKDFCIDSLNPFCTAYTSFITKNPSMINIEALSDAEVSVWPASFILPLFETLPWLYFSKRSAEALFIRKEKREISLLKDTALERYQKFIEEFRDVTQRVSQYYIASYLGITPESLSRIRNQLIRR